MTTTTRRELWARHDPRDTLAALLAITPEVTR
jgi:hypothetical protein